MSKVKDRFLSYVTYFTQSEVTSKTYPSTEGQRLFAQALLEECKALGLEEVSMDQWGYVTATLPATTDKDCPVVGFLAHMDTSPDAEGKNVKPRLWKAYDGSDLPLKGITLSPAEFPQLLQEKGHTVITSDGTTLLGADDKAGIAEILTALEYLTQHTEIPHGKVRIAFTPDEEIGKGVTHFDIAKFGVDFAYTMDGGALGQLEYENFNAARARIVIHGKGVHPGTAKGVMKNAALIGAAFINRLDTKQMPQETEGYEGFYHLTQFTGRVNKAKISIIIRDFDVENFAKRKQWLTRQVRELEKEYQVPILIHIWNEYANMLAGIQKNPLPVQIAYSAMLAEGISPVIQPIRGGTDGAQLTAKGLPCPNLFTGGHNFHGPYEYISVESMESAVGLITKIIAMVASDAKFEPAPLPNL